MFTEQMYTATMVRRYTNTSIGQRIVQHLVIARIPKDLTPTVENISELNAQGADGIFEIAGEELRFSYEGQLDIYAVLEALCVVFGVGRLKVIMTDLEE